MRLKTVKSDVICAIVFNVVYNFTGTLIKYFKTVLQYLDNNFNTEYKVCVLCIWGALLITRTTKIPV